LYEQIHFYKSSSANIEMATTTSRNASPSRIESLEEAHQTIKRQTYDLKLLNNDNKLKDQQINILKAKFKEIENTSHEFQSQIFLLEKTLSNCEEQSRLQSEVNHNQITKLSIANDSLSQTNHDLQQRIKVLESQQKLSKEGLGEVLQEIQELRLRSNKSQQAILDTRDILYKKQKELADTEMALLNTRNENEELRRKIEDLRMKLLEANNETENLKKMIKEKGREGEIYSKVNEK